MINNIINDKFYLYLYCYDCNLFNIIFISDNYNYLLIIILFKRYIYYNKYYIRP
jgi:hypothetical protein